MAQMAPHVVLLLVVEPVAPPMSGQLAVWTVPDAPELELELELDVELLVEVVWVCADAYPREERTAIAAMVTTTATISVFLSAPISRLIFSPPREFRTAVD